MAKQIKRSEIAEKDLYKEIRDSAKKTVTKIDSLNKSLKKTAEVIKTDLSAPLDKTVSGLTKLNTSVNKMNTVMTESVKLDKAKAEALKVQKQAEQEIYKVEQQRQKALQQQMNTEKKVRVESERLAKIEAKRTKGLKDQNNAYKQLVIKTRDQKNESKRLGAELLKLESSGKKNTKAYRQLSTQFNKVTRSAQKGDKALKKLDGRVGDNFRNVGNYGKAIGKLSGAFASLGLAMGGAMVIRNVLGVIKNFDQAQANLASVLGVSRDQMKALTEQSKELGATTRFTASEVSELQLEFAKLGFTQEQIEGMTEATLNLAAASGSELGETASIVGATMRGFGLDVSETQRVTDVMSKSFTTSSLDMSKFATAMASVAPVAKLSGKTIEETTALIGTLTDRGIDASTAGTGLRNMFLRANKAGLTFDEALMQVNSATDKTGEAMELFGTRGATLGVVLAENTEGVHALTEGLNDAEGATEKMAEMQINTLGGALDLLKSAWEGFILSMNDAGGVGEKLRFGLKFLADNLRTILKSITLVAVAFTSYKSSMLISTVVMKAYRIATVAFTVVQALLTGNFKRATAAMRLFNIAVKANPIGLLISLVTTAVTAMVLFADKTTLAEKAQKSFNEGLEEGEEAAKKLVGELAKVGDEERRIIRLKQTRGEITAQEATQETLQSFKDEAKEYEKAYLNAYDKIGEIEERRDKRIRELNDDRAKIETDQGSFKSTRLEQNLEFREDAVILGAKEIAIAQAEANEAEKALDLANQKVDEIEAQIEGAKKKNLEEKLANEEEEKNDKKREERQRVANTQFRRTIDLRKEELNLLNKRNELEEKFAKLTQQSQIKDIDTQISEEKKIQTENVALGIDFDESKLKDLINKRGEIIIQGIERTNEYVKQVEQGNLDERFFKEEEKIKKQYAKLLSQDKINTTEKAKIEANLQDELDIIDEARKISQQNLDETIVFMDAQKNEKIIQAKKDTNKKIEEVDDNKIEVIEGVFNRERQEFKKSLLRTKKTNEEISKEMLKFDIEQLEKKIEAYEKANLDILALELQLEELKRQETLKFDEQTISDKKSLADQELAIVQGLTNAYNELADKRISKIQEEIDMAKKRYDSYVELAKNGNITAKESLAVESKLIAEANLRKEKEEKRKQRVQLASSVLQSYITNSANPNVKNPLAKTITDTVLLTEFIKSLPAFAEGTEDTGKNGRGIDGKGGFQAILHPNERVLTKDQNKLVGGMSNEDLSQLAYQYQNGLIVRGINDGSDAMINAENQLLLKKLDSLENTIKNKPETNIELEEIIGGVMSITRQKKQGNTKIYNRYRVN